MNIFPYLHLGDTKFGHPLKRGVSKERFHCKTRVSNHCFFLFSSFLSPLSLFFSFAFPSLVRFLSLSCAKNLPFDFFSLKWLQLSSGSFSKKLTRTTHAACQFLLKIKCVVFYNFCNDVDI